MREKGLTVIEVVIAMTIVAVLAYFSFPRYAQIWKSAKELALMQEMAAMKQGIYLYVLKYQKYPASLEELEKKGLINFEGESESRLKIKYVKKGKNGEFIDPFGNKYLYNRKNGSVKSSTPGYENY